MLTKSDERIFRVGVNGWQNQRGNPRKIVKSVEELEQNEQLTVTYQKKDRDS